MGKQIIETTNKPWGYYQDVARADGAVFKKIHISDGSRTSLQSHRYRDEYWYVIQGTGVITIGDDIFKCKKDDVFHIPKNVKHRIEATNKTGLEIMEYQTGTRCVEDDITRYEDDYGR